MRQMFDELQGLVGEVEGMCQKLDAVQFADSLPVDGGAGVYDAIEQISTWLRNSQKAFDFNRAQTLRKRNGGHGTVSDSGTDIRKNVAKGRRKREPANGSA
jgi:hypothetical protein